MSTTGYYCSSDISRGEARKLSPDELAFCARLTQEFPILITDDDRDLLQIYEEIFTNTGFQVITTPYAEDALMICQLQPVSLIISDVLKQRGRVDGIELYQRVKKIPNLQHVPFLFVTAYSYSWLSNRVGEVDGYLGKPLFLEDLLCETGLLLLTQRSV